MISFLFPTRRIVDETVATQSRTIAAQNNTIDLLAESRDWQQAMVTRLLREGADLERRLEAALSDIEKLRAENDQQREWIGRYYRKYDAARRELARWKPERAADGRFLGGRS